MVCRWLELRRRFGGFGNGWDCWGVVKVIGWWGGGVELLVCWWSLDFSFVGIVWNFCLLGLLLLVCLGV